MPLCTLGKLIWRDHWSGEKEGNSIPSERSDQSRNTQIRNRYRVPMILTLPARAERRRITKKCIRLRIKTITAA